MRLLTTIRGIMNRLIEDLKKFVAPQEKIEGQEEAPSTAELNSIAQESSMEPEEIKILTAQYEEQGINGAELQRQQDQDLELKDKDKETKLYKIDVGTDLNVKGEEIIEAEQKVQQLQNQDGREQ